MTGAAARQNPALIHTRRALTRQFISESGNSLEGKNTLTPFDRHHMLMFTIVPRHPLPHETHLVAITPPAAIHRLTPRPVCPPAVAHMLTNAASERNFTAGQLLPPSSCTAGHNICPLMLSHKARFQLKNGIRNTPRDAIFQCQIWVQIFPWINPVRPHPTRVQGVGQRAGNGLGHGIGMVAPGLGGGSSPRPDARAWVVLRDPTNFNVACHILAFDVAVHLGNTVVAPALRVVAREGSQQGGAIKV